MKSGYLIGIIILLIAVNLTLLYKYWQLQKKFIEMGLQEGQETLKLNSIPEFQLQDLEGKIFNSNDLRNYAYSLLIFFSPGDCASCLVEKDLWNRIYKENKVKIVGIARHTDLRELKDWVKNSEIFFQVLFDENSRLMESLGIKQTPVKILIDRHGKVLLVDRVRITQYQQEMFLKRLDKIIKRVEY